MTKPRAFGLLFVALACQNGTTLVAQCESDSDCATNLRCALSGSFEGYCVCANDQACSQDAGPAFCNPAGQCQVKVGCASDADCQGNSFCDLRLQLCVNAPACGSDLDCSIGSVCDDGDGGSQTCIAGCHTDGDCPIDVPCVCGNGQECVCPLPDAGAVDPASYDNSLCAIGTCNANTCANDTSLCPYNDLCVGGSDGGLSVCELDPRTDVLCRDCAGSVAGQACGIGAATGADFCLIDLTFGDLFCGVDCSQGQPCPSGYECDDIIILTQSVCQRDSDCTPTGAKCLTDGGSLTDGGTCPIDSRCAASGDVGQCAGYCIMQEDATSGFCSCVTDSDCPADECDPSSRRCNISLESCDPSVPNSCSGIISCVDFGGQRGCYIGQNCAPTHGLKCPLTQSQ